MNTSFSPRQRRQTLYRVSFALWTLILWNAVTADRSDPFFVVSTVDGSIGVLNAFDGTLVGGFRSGTPLVGPSEILSGGRRIVPGLDGRLYVSLEDQEGLLQPLEITILDVLQTPVKTCKERNCGIVTATKSTSLFALDSKTGRLVWKQSPNGTTIIADLSEEEQQQHQQHQGHDAALASTVLLQREDVLVQQLSTDSGKSVWNVTLGTVQALEFGEGNGGSDSLPMGGAYLPSGDSRQLLMQGYFQQVELPSVIFGPDGTSLMAVATTGTEEVRVLWKRDFPTVVASVFGLQDKTWKPLTVLDDPDANGSKAQLSAEPTTRSLLTIYQPPLLQRLFLYWTNPLSVLDRLVDDWFLATRHARRRHTTPSSSRLWAPVDVINEVTVPKKHTLTPLYEHHAMLIPPRRTLALPSSPFEEEYTSRHGVFLTWPILVGICIIVVGIAALIFRYLYLQKKHKWILLLQHMARGDNPTSEQASSAPSTPAVTLKRSHSLPDVGVTTQSFPRRHRSESLQISHTADGRMVYDKELEEKEAAITEPNSSINDAQPPEPPQTQGVGFLVDGIPLIRYNRYDSEFSEVVALGKGGFGTVFRCKNVLDGREYAIKKVSLKYKEGLPLEEFRQQLQRTLREVKSLALLDHPNIVRYYTAWLELQQNEDQDETRRSSRQLADSDYYLFSATTYTKSHGKISQSETASHCQHSSDNRYVCQNGYHPTSNPLGGWSGLNESKTNEPSFQPFFPGIPAHLDDYGFTFDRDDDDIEGSGTTESDKNKQHTTEEKSKSLGFLPESPVVHRYSSNYSSSGVESSVEGSTTQDWLQESQNRTEQNGSMTETSTEERELKETKTPVIMVKHILYIQMQFCSQKTLADFLSNAEARKGGESSGQVDIPYALSLFLQIALGVQHVHGQGLIHRDLKPNNCFIDDSGVVKVGDFGLSRESANENREGLDPIEEVAKEGDQKLSTFGEITAGVGTRSYASPEQMKGSDYDSSTDIYSLGIILFELCYPMYTGMERTIVLSNLRNHQFPDEWMDSVRPAFPTLHTLLQSMISNSPADRPTAVIVVSSIQTILEGFTISSIDKQHHENAILLRVEAKPREDVLRHTMKLVEEAAYPDIIEIVQYGLRGGTNKAVMEFAISTAKCGDPTALGNTLVDRLDKCEEILLIRQVSGTKYTYSR